MLQFIDLSSHGPVCVIPSLVMGGGGGAVPWGQMDTGVSSGGLHICVNGHLQCPGE